MNRAIIGLAVVLVSAASPYIGETDIYSDAKEYLSFEEWSNAHHGISKEQQEEDERKWQEYLSYKYGDETSDDEEPQRKLKESVYEDMPYLKQFLIDQQEYEASLKMESASASRTGDTDMSPADTFIAGTATAVIVSLISWAYNKFKHRK